MVITALAGLLVDVIMALGLNIDGGSHSHGHGCHYHHNHSHPHEEEAEGDTCEHEQQFAATQNATSFEDGNTAQS